MGIVKEKAGLESKERDRVKTKCCGVRVRNSFIVGIWLKIYLILKYDFIGIRDDLILCYENVAKV